MDWSKDCRGGRPITLIASRVYVLFTRYTRRSGGGLYMGALLGEWILAVVFLWSVEYRSAVVECIIHMRRTAVFVRATRECMCFSWEYKV